MKSRKNIYRKSASDVVRSMVLPVLFTVTVLVMMLYGLRQTEISSRTENLRILDESLRRAVVTNYSIHGNYPQSVSEITERYGIFVDKTKYVVHYSIFASNIMPDLAVFETQK
ncbi:MAG: hypothetical protein FWG88_10800 [Oscillospiraceae bacterium]|nr:hypothetical protein [Oscillospiraceae bacterium]